MAAREMEDAVQYPRRDRWGGGDGEAHRCGGRDVRRRGLRENAEYLLFHFTKRAKAPAMQPGSTAAASLTS